MSPAGTALGCEVRPDAPLPVDSNRESSPETEAASVHEVPLGGSATLFDEVLRGEISPEALRWLMLGFGLFERSDWSIPLERCLRLPTRNLLRRQRRNALICDAWKLLSQGGESRTRRGRLLGAELDKFERANWREWKDLDDPPDSASGLRATLFRLMKSLDGEERPCNERLAQILAQTFGE